MHVVVALLIGVAAWLVLLAATLILNQFSVWVVVGAPLIISGAIILIYAAHGAVYLGRRLWSGF